MRLGDQYIGRAVRRAHIVSLPKPPRTADSGKETSTERRLCVSGGGGGGDVDICDLEFEPRHVHSCMSVSVCVVLPRGMTQIIRNADTRLPHGERLAN